MNHGTYLFINGITLLFPLLLSFDRKVRFISGWKGILPAIFIPAIFFLSWDEWFAREGVWSFNPEYVSGSYIGSLPVEEWLFFITVPYACLFIYACLKAYFPDFSLKQTRHYFLVCLLLFSCILLVLFREHIYSCIAICITLLCTLWLLMKKPRWADHFLLAFLVSLLPFLLVNGMLTALPVVSYDNAENMGIRIGTIPADDLFYHFALFTMNVAIYERFKK